MFVLNNQNLDEFFQELGDVSLTTGELGILIENLPVEIDSDISLSHLVFSLQNYPRKIVWFTNNQHVFEFFYKNRILIYKFNPNLNANNSRPDPIQTELDRQDISSNSSPHIYSNLVVSEPVYKTEQEPKFENIAETEELDEIFNQDNLDQSTSKNLEITDTKQVHEDLANNQITHLEKEFSYSINYNLNSSVFHSDTLQPPAIRLELPLAEKNDLDFDIEDHEEDYSIKEDLPVQHLNKLRSSMLTSKQALESINNLELEPKILQESGLYDGTPSDRPAFDLVSEQIKHLENLQNKNSIKSAIKNTRSIKLKSLNKVYLFSFALVSSLAAVVIILGFPTVAYTVEIQPRKEESTKTFLFEKAALRKQNSQFSLKSSTKATGTIDRPSSRAKGKVRLLNKTNNEITLETGQFYVEKDGQRYNLVTDTTRPTIIIIPPKNHLSGPIVEITVESASTESQTQTEGTEMIPRNLRGVPIGPNFKATVSETIQSQKNSGNKTVTESDLRTLRSSIESDLTEQKANKISDLESTKEYIAHSTWSNNLQSEFNFSQKIGDQADEVNVEAKISTDIYYISAKDLSDQILASEPNADKVVRTEISNSNTAWNNENQRLNLNVKYIFTLKSDLNTTKLRQIAQENGLNTNKTSTAMKQSSDTISDVKPQISGIAIPGVSPRVELEVVQSSQE
jgi:hypothetical protein